MGAFLYGIAWLLFATVHSLLARNSIQRALENYLGRWYRLAYNLLAIFLILLILFAGMNWLNTNTLAMFNNEITRIFSTIIRLSGYVLLLVAFASYDIGRFIGITQVIKNERVSSENNEPLQRLGLNRWVRHPLYTAAFILLWGGALSMYDLWTAVWGTLYLVIGTIFEERKLIRVYGEEYNRYIIEVPRYFPTPTIGR